MMEPPQDTGGYLGVASRTLSAIGTSLYRGPAAVLCCSPRAWRNIGNAWAAINDPAGAAGILGDVSPLDAIEGSLSTSFVDVDAEDGEGKEKAPVNILVEAARLSREDTARLWWTVGINLPLAPFMAWVYLVSNGFNPDPLSPRATTLATTMGSNSAIINVSLASPEFYNTLTALQRFVRGESDFASDSWARRGAKAAAFFGSIVAASGPALVVYGGAKFALGDNYTPAAAFLNIGAAILVLVLYAPDAYYALVDYFDREAFNGTHETTLTDAFATLEGIAQRRAQYGSISSKEALIEKLAAIHNAQDLLTLLKEENLQALINEDQSTAGRITRFFDHADKWFFRIGIILATIVWFLQSRLVFDKIAGLPSGWIWSPLVLGMYKMVGEFAAPGASILNGALIPFDGRFTAGGIRTTFQNVGALFTAESWQRRLVTLLALGLGLASAAGSIGAVLAQNAGGADAAAHSDPSSSLIGNITNTTAAGHTPPDNGVLVAAWDDLLNIPGVKITADIAGSTEAIAINSGPVINLLLWLGLAMLSGLLFLCNRCCGLGSRAVGVEQNHRYTSLAIRAHMQRLEGQQGANADLAESPISSGDDAEQRLSTMLAALRDKAIVLDQAGAGPS